MSEVNAAVAAHYGDDALSERILTTLRDAGLDLDALTPDNLKPLDQFHVGGQPATLALANLAGISAGMRVLDVGGGIGGPARTLASAFGCHVTVLDLSEPFCMAGAMLTARTGLSDKVAFQQGDAQAMPFADASFDLVWTQHSSMNVPDKIAMYREIARVLRPGGRLAVHEVIAGSGGAPRLPVPWAREPVQSYLVTEAEVEEAWSTAGLREVIWNDLSGRSLEWLEAMRVRQETAGEPPKLGIHLLLGPEFAEMSRNLIRNLAEERIRIIQAVLDVQRR